MLFRLALLLTLFTTPLHAGACEENFRAGLADFAALDAGISAVEGDLYGGLGWVSRAAVLARLERRSARTTACAEVAGQRGTLDVARQHLDRAAQAFRLASALCIGENRARALGNIDALGDSARALDDLIGYVGSLQPLCGPGP